MSTINQDTKCKLIQLRRISLSNLLFSTFIQAKVQKGFLLSRNEIHAPHSLGVRALKFLA